MTGLLSITVEKRDQRAKLMFLAVRDDHVMVKQIFISWMRDCINYHFGQRVSERGQNCTCTVV